MDEDLALAMALQAQEEEFAGHDARADGFRIRAAYADSDDDDDDDGDQDDDDKRDGGKKGARAGAGDAKGDAKGDQEAVPSSGASEKKRRGPKDGKVIMKRMLEHGLVTPGENALSTTHNKKETLADLKEDGTVVWRKDGEEKPLEFNSVTEFRLAVVRLVNPERKNDNGWDWVRFGDVKLNDLKKQLPPEEVPEKPVKVPREKKVTKATGPSTPKKRKKKDADDVAFKVAGVRADAVIPREKRASRNATKVNVFDNEGERQGDLQMVPCEQYRGSRQQPFKVTTTAAVELVIDFHSHLCKDEIIGFLGGSFDAETKTLRVTRALPARQLKQDHAGVEVELDPESVPDIVETLTANDERIVGWYHSHPVFATHPSVRDIENQVNYQMMFDDGGSSMSAPFVGAIIGPYDMRNETASSDVRWFHAVTRGDYDAEPYELKVDKAGCVDVPGHVVSELKVLADRFRSSEMSDSNDNALAPIDTNVTPVALTEHWRDGATRLQKLEQSITSRLPAAWDENARGAYVGGVVKYLRKSWKL